MAKASTSRVIGPFDNTIKLTSLVSAKNLVPLVEKILTHMFNNFRDKRNIIDPHFTLINFYLNGSHPEFITLLYTKYLREIHKIIKTNIKDIIIQPNRDVPFKIMGNRNIRYIVIDFEDDRYVNIVDIINKQIMEYLSTVIITDIQLEFKEARKQDTDSSGNPAPYPYITFIFQNKAGEEIPLFAFDNKVRWYPHVSICNYVTVLNYLKDKKRKNTRYNIINNIKYMVEQKKPQSKNNKNANTKKNNGVGVKNNNTRHKQINTTIKKILKPIEAELSEVNFRLGEYPITYNFNLSTATLSGLRDAFRDYINSSNVQTSNAQTSNEKITVEM